MNVKFVQAYKAIHTINKLNKTHLDVLLGYETIIWHKQISNLGFSPIPMRAHCAYEARAEFCQIFHWFFGQWSFKNFFLRFTDL